MCDEEKTIVAEFSSEATPDSDRFYCNECYHNLNTCRCDICNEESNLHSYNNHLLDIHSKEQMARYISENKRNLTLGYFG